jgi:hypothetical protein
MNDKKKCSKCELKKTLEDFNLTKTGVYSVCKTCQTEHRLNYEAGINADLSQLAYHSRTAIIEARELLTLMGYDLNEDINLQFKERIMLKYGVDIDNPPKRPKNPFKRFI